MDARSISKQIYHTAVHATINAQPSMTHQSVPLEIALSHHAKRVLQTVMDLLETDARSISPMILTIVGHAVKFARPIMGRHPVADQLAESRAIPDLQTVITMLRMDVR